MKAKKKKKDTFRKRKVRDLLPADLDYEKL